MERVFISEMTPTLLRERLAVAPIAYLPLGAVEGLGDHLPLGAPGFYAQGLLDALAREVGGVVLPTLFLTPSDENDGTAQPVPPGSVFAASGSAFDEIMECLLRGLPGLGVRIVVVHGYPQSLEAVERNRAAWQEKYALRIFAVEPPVQEDPNGGDPPLAVGLDTCLMMAICPELVEFRYLSPDRRQWPPGINGPDPHSSVYAERGERSLDQQVHTMAAILRQCIEDLRR